MADCERSNSHRHDDVSPRPVRRFSVRAGPHLADPWHAPHNGASIIVAPSAADCAWTVVGLVGICRGAARDDDYRRIDRARTTVAASLFGRDVAQLATRSPIT